MLWFRDNIASKHVPPRSWAGFILPAESVNSLPTIVGFYQVLSFLSESTENKPLTDPSSRKCVPLSNTSHKVAVRGTPRKPGHFVLRSSQYGLDLQVTVKSHRQ